MGKKRELSEEEKKAWLVIPRKIAIRYGNYMGAVYAALWYFSEANPEQTCTKPLRIISQLSCVSKKTVIKHINLLIAEGYVEDLTPNNNQAPHEYRVTEKLDMNKVREEQTELYQVLQMNATAAER